MYYLFFLWIMLNASFSNAAKNSTAQQISINSSASSQQESVSIPNKVIATSWMIDNLLGLLNPANAARCFMLNSSSKKSHRELDIVNCFSDQPLSFVNQSITDTSLSSLKNGCYSKIKKLNLIRSRFNPEMFREIPESLVELSIDLPREDATHQVFIENLIDNITKRFKNLEKLDLSNIPLRENEIEKIASSLSNLKELRLSHCSINASHVRKIAQMKALTHLDLSSNNVHDEGVFALSQMKALTHLNLSSNNVRDEGVLALSQMKALTHLDLSSNIVSDEGASILFRMGHLTDLNLSGNAIHGNTVFLAPESSSMTHLNLSDNAIRADQAACLSPVLSKMHQLTHLDLSGNLIIGGTARLLFRSLRHVTHLNLADTGVGHLNEAQIHSFFQGLSQMNHLTHLNLSYNAMGNAGFEILSQMDFPFIHLNLSSNQIDDKKVLDFSKMKNLTHLDLSHNFISNVGARILSAMKHLKDLNLSYNTIDNKEGARIFSQMMDTAQWTPTRRIW